MCVKHLLYQWATLSALFCCYFEKAFLFIVFSFFFSKPILFQGSKEKEKKKEEKEEKEEEEEGEEEKGAGTTIKFQNTSIRRQQWHIHVHCHPQIIHPNQQTLQFAGKWANKWATNKTIKQNLNIGNLTKQQECYSFIGSSDHWLSSGGKCPDFPDTWWSEL